MVSRFSRPAGFSEHSAFWQYVPEWTHQWWSSRVDLWASLVLARLSGCLRILSRNGFYVRDGAFS